MPTTPFTRPTGNRNSADMKADNIKPYANKSKYAIFLDKGIKAFNIDTEDTFKKIRVSEDTDNVRCFIYFSIIKASTLKKLLSFCNNYKGQFRIYFDDGLLAEITINKKHVTT